MRAALAALALVACHRTPAPVCPVPKPIEIIQVPIDCLDGPPPARPGPLFMDCPKDDQGEEMWPGCVAWLDDAKARLAADVLDEVFTYAELAFKRCEPVPTPLPEEGGL